jgi:WD40 repeat protein
MERAETDYAGRFWGVSDVKYAIARDRVLAAASNNFILLWDIESGRKKVEISYPDQDFKSITFSSDGRRLVSLDDGGVVRHWNRSTGALLLTIVSFGDGQWLRVTPDGFFDSSPDGAKNLTVVRGLEVFLSISSLASFTAPILFGRSLREIRRVKFVKLRPSLTKLLSQ